jgi:BirA family biotin operon repressor/biotin-[acetyl-CoA-carboxylase] ligase
MDRKFLQNALRTSPVSELRAYDEIGSTNDEALQWIDAEAPDFALVIADRQTRGRGRLNRQWITQPEASLAFSVILRPTEQETAAPSALYAPMCGLAVWQVLHDQYGLEAQIKWPNDILLQREKCCGILVEAAWSGQSLNGVVLGIGINLRADALPADAVIRFPATWVEKHTKQPVDRFELLAKILTALQYWREHLGSPEFFLTWQDHLAFKGEKVSIVENEISSIIGIEEGIDAAGNLILRNSEGEKISIAVGDVSLRSSQ